MADNAQSKIHYDDFIANVQPDPAKPESTIMLSGFIGHGGDGVVRIYPDPSLGTWYDVPEADVVHSIAVPDSKLGGSYVWVRSSAQIKPGTAAPAAGTGAAGAAEAAAVQPTPTAMPTPATHCFICPPLTQDCTVATACSQQCTTPLAGCLPVQTAATACSQHCTTPLAGCLPVQTVATACSQHCTTPLAGCLPVQTVATACSQHCTTPLAGCLPVQTVATACSQHCTTPLAGCLPVQQQLGLAQTQQNCLHTLPPVCPVNTAATVCTQPPACPHQTAATLCTQNLCHSFVDCTIVGCTHFICPTQPNVCTHQPGCVQPTRPFICSETCVTLPVNCFPQSLPHVCQGVSPNCPPPAIGTPVQQPGVMAAAIQPTPTAQSHCFACPPLTVQQQCVRPTLPVICGLHTAPPACPHQTMGMFCTELCHTLPGGGCWPTQLVICQPTPPQVCTIAVSPNCPPPPPGTPVQQPGVMAAAMQPTPSAVNQCGVHTAATVCQPSVNVICPTPSAVHQCGGHTAPLACQPSVNVICPTPSAVHQCGGHTAPPACQPSVNVVCPTPSAVHQCGVFTPYGR
jgi:hypothetical protein